MMNLVLSIFLSLALALGGTAGLPAEPEFATTWTLRNVALEMNGDAFALAPEARLTASAGTNRVDLHLELESDGDVLAPVSLELAQDEVRASFGTGDRVYSLSTGELERLTGIEADVPPMLDVASAFCANAGTLLGGALGGEPAALRCGLALALAALKTCGSGLEPVRLEMDGVELEGWRTALTLSPANLVALADALLDCGAPELEGLARAALDAINLASGSSFASYAEALGDSVADGIELKLDITAAQGEGLRRCLVECELADRYLGDLLLRADWADSGDGADLNAYLYINGALLDYGGAFCSLDAHSTPVGDLRAEFEVNVDPLQYFARNPLWGCDKLRLVLNSTASGDGLRDVQIDGSLRDSYGLDVAASIGWRERWEQDGSMTASTSLSVDSSGERLAALSFDLNFASGAARDPFEGAEPRALSARGVQSLFRGDPNSAALGADITKLCLDVQQFISDPSLLSLILALSDY